MTKREYMVELNDILVRAFDQIVSTNNYTMDDEYISRRLYARYSVMMTDPEAFDIDEAKAVSIAAVLINIASEQEE